MRDAVDRAGRDLAAIFVDGARVLGRHWPQLLAIFLAGAIARIGFLWLAVWMSNVNSTVGVLLVPFAPLSTLVSFVFMLRVVAESLPAFTEVFQLGTPRERLKTNLVVTSQVLIPFLAVYASQGLLREDTTVFVRDVAVDEILNDLTPEFNRLMIAEGWGLVAVVVGALVARKVIAQLQLGDKNLGWGAFAAYLEALWMVTLAGAMATQFTDLAEWVSSRRVIASIIEWWEGLVAALGPIGDAVTGLLDWCGELIGAAGNLVVVPVAWFAIGATIYGAQLAEEKLVPTHEAMNARIKRVPNPVRRAVAHVVEPVASPVKDTLEALGKVAAAGVVPMVAFCLIFVLTSQVKVVIAWIARLIVGPIDAQLRLGITPFVTLAERAVFFVLTMGLIAAAVNRIVVAQRAAASQAQAGTLNATPSGVSQ